MALNKGFYKVLHSKEEKNGAYLLPKAITYRQIGEVSGVMHESPQSIDDISNMQTSNFLFNSFSTAEHCKPCLKIPLQALV